MPIPTDHEEDSIVDYGGAVLEYLKPSVDEILQTSRLFDDERREQLQAILYLDADWLAEIGFGKD